MLLYESMRDKWQNGIFSGVGCIWKLFPSVQTMGLCWQPVEGNLKGGSLFLPPLYFVPIASQGDECFLSRFPLVCLWGLETTGTVHLLAEGELCHGVWLLQLHLGMQEADNWSRERCHLRGNSGVSTKIHITLFNSTKRLAVDAREAPTIWSGVRAQNVSGAKLTQRGVRSGWSLQSWSARANRIGHKNWESEA